MNLIRDLLYADDCDLVAHTEATFELACTGLGLTISLRKTVVMYQPAPNVPYQEPSIYVYVQKLKAVKKFVYLGGTLNMTGTLNDEICLRISKARVAFGKLDKRLWGCHGIFLGTKVKVCNACVLSSLLYVCETWATYRKPLQRLERFHQQCLRNILGISCKMYVGDIEVLERAQCQCGINDISASIKMEWTCGQNG